MNFDEAVASLALTPRSDKSIKVLDTVEMFTVLAGLQVILDIPEVQSIVAQHAATMPFMKDCTTEQITTIAQQLIDAATKGGMIIVEGPIYNLMSIIKGNINSRYTP